MPLCLPTYETDEKYLANKDILIRKTICTIRGTGGDCYAIAGGPAVVGFTVSQRKGQRLKNAYVKLGSVYLGWFKSTPEEGVFIEDIPLPEPFEWKTEWPSLDRLVDCNIQKKIEEEFGININWHL